MSIRLFGREASGLADSWIQFVMSECWEAALATQILPTPTATRVNRQEWLFPRSCRFCNQSGAAVEFCNKIKKKIEKNFTARKKKNQTDCATRGWTQRCCQKFYLTLQSVAVDHIWQLVALKPAYDGMINKCANFGKLINLCFI